MKTWKKVMFMDFYFSKRLLICNYTKTSESETKDFRGNTQAYDTCCVVYAVDIDLVSLLHGVSLLCDSSHC